MAIEGDDIGIRIKKTTGITLSVSVLVALLIGVAAWVRADTNLRRDLREFRQLAESNSVALQELSQQLEEMTSGIGRIEIAASDRWTRTQMRKLVRQWGADNPGLEMPDVDDIN